MFVSWFLFFNYSAQNCIFIEVDSKVHGVQNQGEGYMIALQP